MKKITTLTFLAILACVQLFAQKPEFFKSYNAGKSILWFYAEPTATGYIYVGTEGTNLVWAKADTGGTITTCKEYHAPFNFVGQVFLIGDAPDMNSNKHTMIVSKLPGNDILITCLYGVNGLGLLKLNANGAVVWANKYSLTAASNVNLTSVSVTNSGKYAWVTGYGKVGKVKTGFIIKADSNGTIAQSNSLVVDSVYNSAGSFYQFGSMLQDKNNNCYIVLTTIGAVQGPDGGPFPENGIFIKTDSLLNVKFAKPGPIETTSMVMSENNIFTVQFYTVENPPQVFYYNLFTEYDTLGNIISNQKFAEFEGACTELLPAADGGVFCYGSRADGFYNGTIIKFTALDTLQWAKYYDLDQNDMEQVNSVLPTSDGGLIVTGNASTNTTYNLTQGYVCKTDSVGGNVCYDNGFSYFGNSAGAASNINDSVIISPFVVNDSALTTTTTTLLNTMVAYCYNNNILTSTNNLSAVEPEVTLYPNPNHGSFTVKLGTRNSESKIEVYNMLGEKVYSTSLSTINSTFLIDLGNQPSGIYLYRVLSQNNTFIATGKFVVE